MNTTAPAASFMTRLANLQQVMPVGLVHVENPAASFSAVNDHDKFNEWTSWDQWTDWDKADE